MIGRPELLDGVHQVGDFYSGDPALDEWLLWNAFPNQWSRNSRTYVAAEQTSKQVLGYYTLSMGLVMLTGLPESITKIFGNPMRVMVLSRVAVHQNQQQGTMEAGLVKDAIHQVVNIQGRNRVRVLMANPLSLEQRERFIGYGFDPFLHDPYAVMMIL